MFSPRVLLGALRSFIGPEARITHAKSTFYGRAKSDTVDGDRIQGERGTTPEQNDDIAKMKASVEELTKRLNKLEQIMKVKSSGWQERRITDSRDLRKKLTQEEKAALDKDILGARSVRATEVLLAKGADVDSRDENNNTPLANAARRGHTETVNALLAWGAQVNVRAQDDDTPLIIASSQGHLQTVKTLIEYGAAIDARVSNNQTALMCAARDGYPQICYELIVQGADVNARSDEGWTPLMFASHKNKKNLSVIPLLIDNGADLRAENEKGQTAWGIAWDEDFKSVVVDYLSARK